MSLTVLSRTTIFLSYINDLDCAIKYCSVYYFAHDKNLLSHIKNSFKNKGEVCDIYAEFCFNCYPRCIFWLTTFSLENQSFRKKKKVSWFTYLGFRESFLW